MSRGEIASGQGGQRSGRFSTVSWFDTIDSTNRYLLEQAAAGAPDGMVATAAHQTAGRGRRGRVWDSKTGASLLFSVLLRRDVAALPTRAVQAVGLAVIEGLRQEGGFLASLKWPNDLVIGSRKLAGILAEASSTGATLDALVVGCGINLNWGAHLPESLRTTAISADEAAGHSLDRARTLNAILDALEQVLASPETITTQYRLRCSTLGQAVRIEQAGGEVFGTAVDVDDEGALVLQLDDGTRQTFTVGNVVHLRAR